MKIAVKLIRIIGIIDRSTSSPRSTTSWTGASSTDSGAMRSDAALVRA